jgi:hypothetical protein
MRGGSTQRAQHVGPGYSNNTKAVVKQRRPAPGRPGARKPSRTNIYRRRRILAVSVVLLSILVLVLAAFAQDSEVSDRGLPIDPNNAGPDVILTEVAGLYISSPIRPENLTGLGYHPEGESLVQMSPRGRNLSGNSISRLFAADSTPEKIQYYLMDPAGRPGPRTGVLDVGAEAGTTVYAPVTGTVVAIRPDPVLQEGGKVVEIKPADSPNIRVNVSFVQEINGELGPKSPVTAGITELGKVADSRKVLSPQLASYTSGTGNHVTISVPKIN